MLNMIKLDWLGMKYYQKRMAFITLLFFFCFGFQNPLSLIPVLAVLMFVCSCYPFAVEEKGKLDHLYLTLPVTRKDIVRARYGLSFIMVAVGLAAGVVLTFLMTHLRALTGVALPFQADGSAILMILCVSLLVCAVLNLSMFPIMFKVGYLKGRMWGLYLPVIVIGSLIVAFWLLCVNNGSVQAWVDQAEIWVAGSATWIAIIFLALAALLLAFSYTLSCRIYAKRDF